MVIPRIQPQNPSIHMIKTLCFSSLLLPVCLADTIVLQDGTKVEGKILRTTEESCVIQVQVTKSIRDERTIPRSTIRSIVKEDPAVAAFEAVRNLGSVPELAPKSEYDVRIAAVEKFLKAYPAATSAADAKTLLAKLKQEREVIAAGGVKFGGKLVSAAEKRADAYEIDAKVAASEIHALAKDGQVTAALRKFTRFDRNFAGSAVYKQNLPALVNMLQTFSAQVSAQAADVPRMIQERKKGLAAMPQADRQRAITLIKEEQADYERRVLAEKAAREPWLSLDPYHAEVLGETSRLLQQEIQRLRTTPPATGDEPGEVYRESWKSVHGSTDPKVIESALKAARTAHIPEAYLTQIREAGNP